MARRLRPGSSSASGSLSRASMIRRGLRATLRAPSLAPKRSSATSAAAAIQSAGVPGMPRSRLSAARHVSGVGVRASADSGCLRTPGTDDVDGAAGRAGREAAIGRAGFAGSSRPARMPRRRAPSMCPERSSGTGVGAARTSGAAAAFGVARPPRATEFVAAGSPAVDAGGLAGFVAFVGDPSVDDDSVPGCTGSTAGAGCSAGDEGGAGSGSGAPGGEAGCAAEGACASAGGGDAGGAAGAGGGLGALRDGSRPSGST
jgi:hypothetical protein